jgi:hypothetical protein
MVNISPTISSFMISTYCIKSFISEGFLSFWPLFLQFHLLNSVYF